MCFHFVHWFCCFYCRTAYFILGSKFSFIFSIDVHKKSNTRIDTHSHFCLLFIPFCYSIIHLTHFIRNYFRIPSEKESVKCHNEIVVHEFYCIVYCSGFCRCRFDFVSYYNTGVVVVATAIITYTLQYS